MSQAPNRPTAGGADAAAEYPYSTREWATEAVTPDLHQLTRIRGIVYEGRTKYQQVEILDTETFGRVLRLDGKTQSSQSDEYVYHEALVHPVMLHHPAPRRVFIGGGGEGATLREVLRHRAVESVVMVDLDEEVVNLCKEHLPTWHQGAFDDPRVELRHEDAHAYLENADQPFDVMILDLVDPMEAGPAYRLYTQEFYRMAMDRLTEHGALVVQSGPAIAGMTAGPATDANSHEPEALTDLVRGFTALHHTLNTVYPVVTGYSPVIMDFGGAWSFVLASKGTENPSTMTPEQVDALIAERINVNHPLLRRHHTPPHLLAAQTTAYCAGRGDMDRNGGASAARSLNGARRTLLCVIMTDRITADSDRVHNRFTINKWENSRQMYGR